MSISILSKRQRTEFKKFQAKNKKNLKDVPALTQVMLWRDGFIVGAIHGYDVGTGGSLSSKDRK